MLFWYLESMTGPQRRACVLSQINSQHHSIETSRNTFVREKQLKAERGILVEAKERDMGEKISLEIAEKDKLVQHLEKVKKFLETAVSKKKKFREFLRSVVEDEKTHGRCVSCHLTIYRATF